MKTLYDNTNLDYPQCGGFDVKSTEKDRYYYLTYYCNIQGHGTNEVYIAKKSDISLDDLVKLAKSGDLDGRFVIKNKGFIVV